MNKQNLKNQNESRKLEKALSRTHTERFELLMKLIRIDKMLKNAKIIHVKPEER
ncbi:MAG: hypothetical protein H0W84_12300 [Bacteroidetes bacterium]|nr:hypothetical protein [Bacteroidota bacterium]